MTTFKNSVNFNIVNDSPSNWLNLQDDYDIDKGSTYANDEPIVIFSCMTYIGQGWSDKISNGEDTQASVAPGGLFDFFSCYH